MNNFNISITFQSVDMNVKGEWDKPSESMIFPDVEINSIKIKGSEMIEEIWNINPKFVPDLSSEISQNYDKYLI